MLCDSGPANRILGRGQSGHVGDFQNHAVRKGASGHVGDLQNHAVRKGAERNSHSTSSVAAAPPPLKLNESDTHFQSKIRPKGDCGGGAGTDS